MLIELMRLRKCPFLLNQCPSIPYITIELTFSALSSLRFQLLFFRKRKGFLHRPFMDGVNQLIPFLSQKKGHRQNETHQEELDWKKHPSSRIHLLKHTLKPQPKNMNIRWLVSLEQIHQQSRKPSPLVLDLTGALIRLFKDIERAFDLWVWSL